MGLRSSLQRCWDGQLGLRRTQVELCWKCITVREFSTLQVLKLWIIRESTPSFTISCGRRDRVFRTFSRSLLTNAWIPKEAVQRIKYHQFTSAHQHSKIYQIRWESTWSTVSPLKIAKVSNLCFVAGDAALLLRQFASQLLTLWERVQQSLWSFMHFAVLTASRLHTLQGLCHKTACAKVGTSFCRSYLCLGAQLADHQASAGNPNVCGMLVPGRSPDYFLHNSLKEVPEHGTHLFPLCGSSKRSKHILVDCTIT